jgi:1-deoxy-D-xylulose-5-phosphate synthase
VVRFPGKEPADVRIDALERVGVVDVLTRAASADVLLVAVGGLAGACVEAAERLRAQGVGVTVVDPRWVKPVDKSLIEFAAEHRLVVTAEDGNRVGGVGSVLAQTLRDHGVESPVHNFGIPARFLDHGKRAGILAELGLTGQGLAREISGLVAALEPGASLPSSSETV